MPGEGHGGPARNYSWEPFREGHELSTRHGAYSPRKVDPLAEQMVDQVLAVAEDEGLPWLVQPSMRPTLWAWARAEARVQLISEWLLEQDGQAGGLLDEDGEVRGAARFLDKLETQAANLRARLGLDPVGSAQLAKVRAQAALSRGDLQAVVERGREVMARRAAEVEGGS